MDINFWLIMVAPFVVVILAVVLLFWWGAKGDEKYKG
ncbi:cytochrome bd oxidase small subunit CydS [Metabacillus lacus]